MKGKYITTHIVLACLRKTSRMKKDIHTQLRETSAEHKKIVEKLKGFSKKAEDIFEMIDKKEAA